MHHCPEAAVRFRATSNMKSFHVKKSKALSFILLAHQEGGCSRRVFAAGSGGRKVIHWGPGRCRLRRAPGQDLWGCVPHGMQRLDACRQLRLAAAQAAPAFSRGTADSSCSHWSTVQEANPHKCLQDCKSLLRAMHMHFSSTGAVSS